MAPPSCMGFLLAHRTCMLTAVTGSSTFACSHLPPCPKGHLHMGIGRQRQVTGHGSVFRNSTGDRQAPSALSVLHAGGASAVSCAHGACHMMTVITAACLHMCIMGTVTSGHIVSIMATQASMCSAGGMDLIQHITFVATARLLYPLRACAA